MAPLRLPESRVTPEGVFTARREFLRALGLGASGLLSGCYLSVSGAEGQGPSGCAATYAPSPLLNPRFGLEGACLTSEDAATRWTNYYELSPQKELVRRLAEPLRTSPWQVEVGGLCERPQVLDLDALAGFPAEERVYRFRCVEAWAMTVPWRGFPFSALAARVGPTAQARYVRFTSAARPDEMPGLRAQPTLPWPYTEGLRLDEALHELTFLATGLYGKPLPKQNGAPLRLVVPWKYGFKSVKAIVRIDFVAEPPATFWSSVWPAAYDFLANVDPSRPHPSWSQATERTLDSGELVPTQPFNGYGELVAPLYR